VVGYTADVSYLEACCADGSHDYQTYILVDYRQILSAVFRGNPPLALAFYLGWPFSMLTVSAVYQGKPVHVLVFPVFLGTYVEQNFFRT
jgi:hypothetical protein